MARTNKRKNRDRAGLFREREHRPVGLYRRKRNRRRVERAELGFCGKREWRDLEAAKRAAVGSLAHPKNPVTAVAIYHCTRCGWFHQSRRLDGPNVVLVLEREAA